MRGRYFFLITKNMFFVVCLNAEKKGQVFLRLLTTGPILRNSSLNQTVVCQALSASIKLAVGKLGNE